MLPWQHKVFVLWLSEEEGKNVMVVYLLATEKTNCFRLIKVWDFFTTYLDSLCNMYIVGFCLHGHMSWTVANYQRFSSLLQLAIELNNNNNEITILIHQFSIEFT